jgi:hypothetical protein
MTHCRSQNGIESVSHPVIVGFLDESQNFGCLDLPTGRHMIGAMKSGVAKIEDRVRVFHAVIKSAWAEEVERRVKAFDRGELLSYPAEDVFAEARRMTAS